MDTRGQLTKRVPTNTNNRAGGQRSPNDQRQGNNQQNQQNQRPPQPTRMGWTWWVLLAILAIWNIWLFWPRGAPSLTIPYSSLLTQVGAGNVKEVSIVGDQISGNFSKP